MMTILANHHHHKKQMQQSSGNDDPKSFSFCLNCQDQGIIPPSTPTPTKERFMSISMTPGSFSFGYQDQGMYHLSTPTPIQKQKKLMLMNMTPIEWSSERSVDLDADLDADDLESMSAWLLKSLQESNPQPRSSPSPSAAAAAAAVGVGGNLNLSNDLDLDSSQHDHDFHGVMPVGVGLNHMNTVNVNEASTTDQSEAPSSTDKKKKENKKNKKNKNIKMLRHNSGRGPLNKALWCLELAFFRNVKAEFEKCRPLDDFHDTVSGSGKNVAKDILEELFRRVKDAWVGEDV
jgi:hypothetical protein